MPDRLLTGGTPHDNSSTETKLIEKLISTLFSRLGVEESPRPSSQQEGSSLWGGPSCPLKGGFEMPWKLPPDQIVATLECRRAVECCRCHRMIFPGERLHGRADLQYCHVKCPEKRKIVYASAPL